MDLSMLREATEKAHARFEGIMDEIKALHRKAREIEFFQEAVLRLCVSWKDEDPGKYAAHWHCFKGGRKSWPRELVDTAAVQEFDDLRITRRPKTDPTPLAPFAELDRLLCPRCEKEGLDVGCYAQTEDGPDGDTWVKTYYVLCIGCVALSQTDSTPNGHRF